METKGKTLEEVDELFEGKHSNVPDVELVRRGKEMIDVKAVEMELSAQVNSMIAEVDITGAEVNSKVA